ncbi:MAG: hypothetical protein WBA67_15720 [Jannaschia sp.]
METVAGVREAVGDWWAALPRIPDLNLPAPGDPDALIVVATIILAIGLMGLVSGWVDSRVSSVSVFAVFLAAALVFWVWDVDRDGFGWLTIPEAFVEMVARILR